MKKNDLKDGMVVTYKCGERRTVIGKNLCEEHPAGFNIVASLSKFNIDLKYISSFIDSCDIVKVEYMGEVLWERVEYVSFIEAIEHGEIIKHKEWVGNHTIDQSIARMCFWNSEAIRESVLSNEWIIVKRKS